MLRAEQGDARPARKKPDSVGLANGADKTWQHSHPGSGQRFEDCVKRIGGADGEFQSRH
jgi:hypothetical protein